MNKSNVDGCKAQIIYSRESCVWVHTEIFGKFANFLDTVQLYLCFPQRNFTLACKTIALHRKVALICKTIVILSLNVCIPPMSFVFVHLLNICIFWELFFFACKTLICKTFVRLQTFLHSPGNCWFTKYLFVENCAFPEKHCFRLQNVYKMFTCKTNSIPSETVHYQNICLLAKCLHNPRNVFAWETKRNCFCLQNMCVLSETVHSQNMFH